MMKMLANLAVAALLLAGVETTSAQEAPQFPEPTKQHQWLAQLVGQWKTTGEATMGPGQPSVTCEGTQTVRSVGGFWTIAELKSQFGEVPMTGVMTLGYDADKEKFVGTWVDSMNDHMWHYEGTLDEARKKLTLTTEGPSPTDPGKTAAYREVIEIKDKNHKVFTSSVKGPDGKWFTFVTIKAHRQ